MATIRERGHAAERAPGRFAEEASPSLSVIVPAVMEEPACLRKCLDGLAAQNCGQSFEVLVITHPDDRLGRWTRGHFPKVTVLHCKPERGPGGARNEGVRAARGEYLVFLDGDCVPAPDWLSRLWAACARNGGAPVKGWTEPSAAGSPAARAERYASVGRARPCRPVRVLGLTGSGMCVARSLFGGRPAPFAEEIYGAEEQALLAAMPPGRRTVVLEPRACVRHLDRTSFAGSLARAWRRGKGSGVMRRSARLPGSFVARHVWLAPLLLPGRLALACWRLRESSWRDRLDFLILLPLVVCYWAAYTAGFITGALDEGCSIKE